MGLSFAMFIFTPLSPRCTIWPRPQGSPSEGLSRNVNVQLDNQLDDSVVGGGIHPRARLLTVKRANDRNDGVQQCSSGGWKVSKIALAAGCGIFSQCQMRGRCRDKRRWGGRQADLLSF